MTQGKEPALLSWTLRALAPLTPQQETYVDGLLSVAFAFLELDPRVFELLNTPGPGQIRQLWQNHPPPRHPQPSPQPAWQHSQQSPFSSAILRLPLIPLIPAPPRTQLQLARFLMGATDSLMWRFWAWNA